MVRSVRPRGSLRQRTGERGRSALTVRFRLPGRTVRRIDLGGPAFARFGITPAAPRPARALPRATGAAWGARQPGSPRSRRPGRRRYGRGPRYPSSPARAAARTGASPSSSASPAPPSTSLGAPPAARPPRATPALIGAAACRHARLHRGQCRGGDLRRWPEPNPRSRLGRDRGCFPAPCRMGGSPFQRLVERPRAGISSVQNL